MRQIFSVAEQLRLQSILEKTVQDAESTLQTIQNAEQRARKQLMIYTVGRVGTICF